MADTLTVAVRQMRPEDAGAVAKLVTQLGYPSTEDEIRRRYDLIKDRWDARLLVAQHAGTSIVGWVHVQALYLLETDARAEIFGLVVADTARGTGVGRRLMEAAEEWALVRGFNVMGLRSNYLRIEAQGFYEHLGYKVVKTQNAFRKNLA
ncbi:MAG TPA: GNAT family N-acetyltransferase [Vicinamibacterales bacterium]|nr:GNAT family N-acetyltransferase [Vicinamibacterales bacterium]